MVIPSVVILFLANQDLTPMLYNLLLEKIVLSHDILDPKFFLDFINIANIQIITIIPINCESNIRTNSSKKMKVT